ncbi:MAG: hypothetical protein QOF89_1743 [Acidobacteriota bacterium]|nr:hypothetical protein [Acidobacteriota bacterium]
MSDLRAPDTSRPPAWPRPKRRRWRELPVRYLIDSRLFRRLCSPEGEAALAGFRAAITRHGLGAGEDLPALELTPMGFLAMIGVTPPHVDLYTLPPAVLKPGESLMATSLVAKLAEPHFREAPELKPDPLRKRVEELRQATDPAAHDLFDLCMTRFVSRDAFEDPIARQLAFDYLYRFPFPDVLREDVFHFLCASLFGTGDNVSGLSKMRVVKVVWDRAYPRLLRANPAARGEIQALDREMKLRTRQDFLDWELIHFAVLGCEAGDGFRPVTAFIPDSAEKLTARAIAYKCALRAFLDPITHDDLAILRHKLDSWRPGTLVSVQEDGTFETLVPTGDLPVFGGEKLGGEKRVGSAEATTPEPGVTEAGAE